MSQNEFLSLLRKEQVEAMRLQHEASQRKQELEKQQKQAQLQKLREAADARRRRYSLEDDDIAVFMEDLEGICRSEDGKIPSLLLHEIYCQWCRKNHILPRTVRSFCLYLKRNASRLRIEPTNFYWQGKHIRGFRGLIADNTDNTHNEKVE